MKINRLLTAALITFATVFTGCVKESVWDRETGIDESKAAPEEFTYDEAASSKNAIAVYWNADKAVAAGAQSFLVQLTDENNMDKGNSWDSKVSKVFKVENGECETNAIFSGLKEYDCYYVRIRANYPGSVYSPWVYLVKEDGTPALMQIGHGEMPLVPVVSAVGLVYDINVTWGKCVGATKYLVEWKKTADSAWQSAETTETTYAIAGLQDNTEYQVRVTAVSDQSYVSDVVTVATKERPPFPMEISTADQWIQFVTGDIIILANNGADDKVTLTADLDFTGKEYPADVVFKGVLDGNGKTIKNLQSANPLFKEVTKVQNLTIDASCAFTTTASAGFAAVTHTLPAGGELNNVVNNASVTATWDNLEDPWVVGALAAYAWGKIEGCTNNGAITLSAASMNTGAAGGIVGFTESEVNNTKNTGAINIHFGIAGAKMKIWETNKWTKAPSIGGIVGLSYGQFAMAKCENTGKIYYRLDDLTVSANYNRTQIGGIVGAPSGDVVECTNKGEIELLHTTTDRSAYTAFDAVICVGGIGGGDWDAFRAEAPEAECITNYIGCVNEGNIIIDSDAAKSNSTVGGIVGWPGDEKTYAVNETKNCINRGNITIKGTIKGRFGGIQGGTGNIVGCENHGNVSVFSCNSASACGLGAAFHSQNHKLNNTKVYGSVTAAVPVSAIGGLIGNNGNAANTTGENCVVDCTITGGNAGNAGMVVGYWNGNTQAVTLGPVEVSGTINGAAASADNLTGTKNYKAGVHTIIATIK